MKGPLTIQRFTGIDNVNDANLLPPYKGATALAEAMNVDIGNRGELRRAPGYSQTSSDAHLNLWKSPAGFTLATDGADLLVIDGEGAETVLRADVGADRMWFDTWPDGRIRFSNGTVCGVVLADGSGWHPHGVPVPASAGTGTDTSGLLHPGSYRWAISYVRTLDGLEGGLAYSEAIDVTGGVVLSDLPELDGYTIRVYLSSHNGEQLRFAGTTDTDAFTYAGPNRGLVLEPQTEHIDAAPAGTLSCIWRGRALVADGKVLWASKHTRWEHFDLSKDFKTFSADITLLQPVQGGVFVGTEHELAFLAGSQWEGLSYQRLIAGRTVLGSGVAVPGEYLTKGEGTAGVGQCMLGIVDGTIVAGYQDGGCARLTLNRYETDATEVAACWLLREGGIPQYIAIPQ